MGELRLLLTVFLVLFVAFKLAGVIEWSWLWVLSPLWGPLAATAIIFGVYGFVALVRMFDS